MTTASGHYPPDLARIHSEGFTGTFAPAFDWLVERIRSGPAPAKLFDIGCGDGTWLAAAQARGVHGEGMDLSPAFVEIAQGRGLKVRPGDAADPEIPPGTTAITCLGEVLSYLGTSGRDTLAPLANAAFAALPPGGTLIADLIGRDCRPEAGRTDNGAWKLRTEITLRHDRLTRRIETQVGDRVDTVTHHQSRRDTALTAAQMRAIGWECRVAKGYGPCPLLPGRFALIMIRP